MEKDPPAFTTFDTSNDVLKLITPFSLGNQRESKKETKTETRIASFRQVDISENQLSSIIFTVILNPNHVRKQPSTKMGNDSV